MYIEYITILVILQEYILLTQTQNNLMGGKIMVTKNKNKKSSAFFIVALFMVVFTALAVSTSAQIDTTRPTILSVSPANNEQDNLQTTKVIITFSEDMNSSTVNAQTFSVMQRSTPEFGGIRSLPINGIVSYSDRTATFVPNTVLSPNQRFGNVFTVTVTSGAKDLAGNSLARDYMWSFTTGGDRFNTGASTSQLDQSSTPVATPPAVSTPIAQQNPVAPVTSTPAITTSAFPWVWILGGLLLLLVLGLIFGLAIKPARQEKSASHKNIITQPNPFGDVHPVVDIEGIGPVYKKELNKMGITNTQQLWKANAVNVVRQTGAPLTAVQSWQHMAELASVKGIGPQYAELLDRSGIHTIAQLKNSDPNKLLRLVRKKQDSLKINIQGSSPGHATVENWIDEARDHKFTEEVTA